jgi:hypothetical protein
MTALRHDSSDPSPLRLEQTPPPLPHPGGFLTVLADLPWRFDNPDRKVAPEYPA